MRKFLLFFKNGWVVMKSKKIWLLQAFTANELKDMTQFYNTPIGKKTIELMPVLL